MGAASQQAIIEYLETHGPATFYELMRLKYREQTIAKAVRALLEAGRVVEVDDGVIVRIMLAP